MALRIGGGGSEKYMFIIPATVGFAAIVYALGGPGQTLIIVENMTQNGLQWVQGLFR